jgi:hypothetical protein
MGNVDALLVPEVDYNAHFNDEDADVVIRAGDKALFRVHKVVLKKASLVFRDMFNIPQSPSIIDDREEIDGLPLVDVTESEHTLELLLTLCYPIRRPDFNDPADIALTLKAAVKYAMDLITDTLRELWASVATSDPLRAFAVACSCGLAEEATVAAKLALKKPIWPLEPPLSPEFRYVSADTVIRLESYHRKCAAAATQRASDSDTIFENARCKHCQGHSWGEGAIRIRMRDWWDKYTRRAAKLLALQPSGHTVMSEELVLQSMADLGETVSLCSLSIHSIEMMRNATEAFRDAIDTAISQVSMHCLFGLNQSFSCIIRRSNSIWTYRSSLLISTVMSHWS